MNINQHGRSCLEWFFSEHSPYSPDSVIYSSEVFPLQDLPSPVTNGGAIK